MTGEVRFFLMPLDYEGGWPPRRLQRAVTPSQVPFLFDFMPGHLGFRLIAQERGGRKVTRDFLFATRVVSSTDDEVVFETERGRNRIAGPAIRTCGLITREGRVLKPAPLM